MRAVRLAMPWLTVLLCVWGLAPEMCDSSVSATAYLYDASPTTRVDVQPFGCAETSPAHGSGSREWSASPSVQTRGTSTTPFGAVVATEAVPNGEFSISNWDGYPAGGPKPEGPFRLLEGDEYSAARNAANKANSALHDADPNLSGLQIHEVQPVKFGGSPTDLANKVVRTPAEHMQYTVWWNRVQRSIS